MLGIIFGGRDEDQKVPPYVKRQLIKAQRALRDGDYVAASKAYHRALERLAGSEYAQTQGFIEARAVVLDKVFTYITCHSVCFYRINSSFS